MGTLTIPSLKEQVEKIKICETCENWTRDNLKPHAGMCKLCGCLLDARHLSAKKCPLDLWQGWQ